MIAGSTKAEMCVTRPVAEADRGDRARPPLAVDLLRADESGLTVDGASGPAATGREHPLGDEAERPSRGRRTTPGSGGMVNRTSSVSTVRRSGPRRRPPRRCTNSSSRRRTPSSPSAASSACWERPGCGRRAWRGPAGGRSSPPARHVELGGHLGRRELGAPRAAAAPPAGWPGGAAGRRRTRAYDALAPATPAGSSPRRPAPARPEEPVASSSGSAAWVPGPRGPVGSGRGLAASKAVRQAFVAIRKSQVRSQARPSKTS